LQTDISKRGPILKILAFLEVFFPKEYENAKAGMNFQFLKSVDTLLYSVQLFAVLHFPMSSGCTEYSQ
jgi:hypothetical protein